MYVFDGAPPKLKTAEVRVPSHFTKLDDRLAKREEANKEILSAQASGTAILIFYLLSDQPEVVGKFMKRTVKVTKEHIAEAKKLLTLMGVPFIQVRGGFIIFFRPLGRRRPNVQRWPRLDWYPLKLPEL